MSGQQQKVQAFYTDVAASIDSHVNQGLNSFKQELLLMAKTKKYNNITPEVINQACDDLKTQLDDQFGKNMTKFRVYSDRNIFVPRIESVEESAATSTQETTSASLQQDIDRLDNEINAMKEKFVQMAKKYRDLTSECEDGNAALVDMRSTIFRLKVDSQALEENKISSLEDATKEIINIKNTLTSLTHSANTLVDNIEASHYGSSTTAPTLHGTGKAQTEITYTSAADMSTLNKGLQRNPAV